MPTSLFSSVPVEVTLVAPTVKGEGRVTVPVKVGEAVLAFALNWDVTVVPPIPAILFSSVPVAVTATPPSVRLVRVRLVVVIDCEPEIVKLPATARTFLGDMFPTEMTRRVPRNRTPTPRVRRIMTVFFFMVLFCDIL